MPSDWRTVGLLVGVFVATILLVEAAGLGDHRRTAVRRLPRRFSAAGTTSATSSIGAVLAVASFYAFYSGLGIPLPAGILDGIL